MPGALVLTLSCGLLAVAQVKDLPMPPPPSGARPAAPASKTEAPPAPQPDARPRLLVSDLAAQGVPAEEAAAFTEALVQEFTARGLFEVRSSRDVAAFVSAERQRQMLGACVDARGTADERCAGELGDTLGARYVLTGALSRVGSAYELSLQVLDTVRGRLVARSTRLARDVTTLRLLLPWAAAEASGSPLPPPKSRVLPYSLMAGGGAAFVAGGFWGLQALSRQRVLNDELCPGEAGACEGSGLRPLAEYRAENDRIGRDKTVALGLMAVGAGLAGLGVYLLPPPEGGPRVAFVPTARGIGFAGVFP